MQRLESAQNASSDSISRTSNLSEQASTLLSERHSVQAGGKTVMAGNSINLESSVYGNTEKAGSCGRVDNACSWKPDESSNSTQSRNWRSQRETQRDKPLDTKDGKYEIKPGDTMNDISKRYLKDLGIDNPSGKEIAGFSKMLGDQNKDQYSILKCNPNLIRPGMKLEMPPADTVARLWNNDVTGSQSPDYRPPSSTWREFEELDSRLSGPNRLEPAPYVEDIMNRKPGVVDIRHKPDQTGAERGNEPMFKCHPDDGRSNLPRQFKCPSGLMNLDKGWFDDAVQLPFNLQKDQPGAIMNLPFKPGIDSPGKLMTLENQITNPTSKCGPENSSKDFLKRLMNHVPLPELMLV